MRILPAAALACALAAIAPAAEVTFESLVREMAGADALARYPQPAFRLRQQSSYNRESKSPAEPKGWFANADQGHFIRTETNAGRQEWVLMEHDGPGAIVRYWMPDRRLMPGQKPVDATVRFYLDGSAEPALEGHLIDLFNGTGLVPPPFGHRSLASAVSYLPVPFAKRCKITLDAQPFYFVIAYRAYPAGTPVRSFSMKQFRAARGLLERTGKRLLEPPVSAGKELAREVEIRPGEEAAIDLPGGPAAVRSLSVRLASYDNPQVTRSVVLAADFDGTETVWCPIGDFFGTGVGLNPFQDRYRTVAPDGTLSARWVMPYRKSGRIRLLNRHREPVRVRMAVTPGAWKWDARSMYFHAGWRRQYPLRTRPFSDWNYVELSGEGVFAGDTLTVYNPVKQWWGEGDEKIWVDGDTFPSLFGTGTEDYYGYSWGGRSRAFYEHPFHGQVRVKHFNKLTERAPLEPDVMGYSTEMRVRGLDGMPFAKSLKLDMEVWHHRPDCEVEYSVGVYWYGRPGATSNRTPDPAAASAPVFRP